LKRLAFLTPLPPAPTGIADYSVEVLALLAERYALDVFHHQERVETLPFSVYPSEDFLPRHEKRPYDLAVYQMGNSLAHAFLYDLLARVPGLLVLHDLVLHHSRAKMFLASPEARAYALQPSSAELREKALPSFRLYEEELAYCYPGQAQRLAETHLATVGDLLPYAYPLFRIPVEASRLTAAHNHFMVEAIRAEVPDSDPAWIPMAAQRVSVDRDAVAALRRRHGIGPDELVVACFGLLTREKRIETVARAIERASLVLPRLRLLLVGSVPDPGALSRVLIDRGIEGRTVVVGRVPFAELPIYLEAADVVAHLRYPTARETSAALLRVLAQGRPAVVSDLENLEVPEGSVLRARLTDEEGELTRAVLRLAERNDERARLGQEAARFVEREHSPARCTRGYEAAIEEAISRPDPPRRAWPSHWPRRP
jgi:glycosyltransferase involved in cell wall biosynthesis